MKKGDLVVLWWVDAACHPGDHEAEDLHGFLSKTTGFLGEITQEYVKVYSTDCGENGASDFTVVPKVLIIDPPFDEIQTVTEITTKLLNEHS